MDSLAYYYVFPYHLPAKKKGILLMPTESLPIRHHLFLSILHTLTHTLFPFHFLL